MLFWITWIIGNLVYVKTYPKSLSSLWPWLYKVTFFLIDIQGHTTQKPDFPLLQDNSILFILFPWLGQPEPFWTKSSKIIQIWLKSFPLTRTSLHWGNLNPFRPKSPKTVQTWLKLYPLTETSHESSLIQKNLSRQFTLLQHIKSASPYNQGSFLNKKKWKNGKRIMIFPSCIWDIWINPNKRNSHKRNEKSENSRKRKIWSD